MLGGVEQTRRRDQIDKRTTARMDDESQALRTKAGGDDESSALCRINSTVYRKAMMKRQTESARINVSKQKTQKRNLLGEGGHASNAAHNITWVNSQIVTTH